jgi:molecular chaperone DnaJ
LAKRDYYEILGVPRDVDPDALKKAYRALAMRDHPDRNPNDPAAEERFKEASEAYAILSDPDKRRAYDRFGHAGVGPGAPGGFQDFGDLGNFTDLFDDLFGDLFGGRRGGAAAAAASAAPISATTSRSISPRCSRASSRRSRSRRCARARRVRGPGARPGTSPETCGSCRGSGQVVLQQGFFRVSRPCDACAGTGEIVRQRCNDCRGQGRVEGQQTLNVRIPPGVDDGTRLRLSGEGEAGIAGGPNGDLYVVIAIRPAPAVRA